MSKKDFALGHPPLYWKLRAKHRVGYLGEVQVFTQKTMQGSAVFLCCVKDLCRKHFWQFTPDSLTSTAAVWPADPLAQHKRPPWRVKCKGIISSTSQTPIIPIASVSQSMLQVHSPADVYTAMPYGGVRAGPERVFPLHWSQGKWALLLRAQHGWGVPICPLGNSFVTNHPGVPLTSLLSSPQCEWS